jgi:hypothetical protein
VPRALECGWNHVSIASRPMGPEAFLLPHWSRRPGHTAAFGGLRCNDTERRPPGSPAGAQPDWCVSRLCARALNIASQGAAEIGQY